MTKLAPEWVRTSDPVIRSSARYGWTTAPALHFRRILDECAPIKETIIPYISRIREPWMTTGLMKSSRKRTLLYRKTIGKDKESNAYKRYIAYRNIYININMKQKRHTIKPYYTNVIMMYGRLGKS